MYTSIYRGSPLLKFFLCTGLKCLLERCNVWRFSSGFLRVSCGDRPAPLLLSLRSVLLRDGPRLDLPAAEYGVDESTADIDPGCQPEHLPPACQGVLTTTEEEEETSAVHYVTDLLCTVTL